MSILKYFKKRQGKDTGEDRDSTLIKSSEEQRQGHGHDKEDIETVKWRKVKNDNQEREERNEVGAGEKKNRGWIGQEAL